MKNATPGQESSALDCTDTSAQTQRIQIIALLKQHQSMNTPEFREHGIMAPAPRIFELKAQGYNIQKVTETYTDNTGKTHHGVARYYLAYQPSNDDNQTEAAA
tara:strand:- start:2 stop:310 length:309 start_codon:yes stop_codon:yes gene_type:complete